MNLPGKKQRDVSVREILALLLLAFLLHGIFLFLFKPVKGIGTAVEQNQRISVFYREDLLKKRDLWNLRHALRYTNPEQMVKADPLHGFSMFQRRSTVRFPDAASWRPGLFSLFSGNFPETPGLLEPRPLIAFSPDALPEETFPAEQSVPLRETEYPVWMDQTGRSFQGFFLKSARTEAFLQRKENVSAPTVLSCKVTAGEPPLIRVLRSCGIPALDLLAEQQLMFAPLSADGKQYVFSVVWNDPAKSLKGASLK